jgi:hypothetical protein
MGNMVREEKSTIAPYTENGFKSTADVDLMCSKDWNTDFGERGAPFGGVGRISRRIEGPSLAVRLRIDRRITEVSAPSAFCVVLVAHSTVLLSSFHSGLSVVCMSAILANAVRLGHLEPVRFSVSDVMFALLVMMGFVARGALVTTTFVLVSPHYLACQLSRDHFAWNDSCAALSARRAAASQLGFSAEIPLTVPRSRPIPSAHSGSLNGRSFAGPK